MKKITVEEFERWFEKLEKDPGMDYRITPFLTRFCCDFGFLKCDRKKNKEA